MMVFSGSSNQALAQSIAQKLGVGFGGVELSRFANSEARVFLSEARVPRQVVVVQSLSAPTDENLVEFCLLCDGLVRKGAKEITAVIPWLGYSKQDKVFREGEPLSVKVIANLLQVVPVERVITFDLHNLAILGFFEVPVVNLSAKPLLVDYFREFVGSNTIVVAPDAGAVKESTAFAGELGVGVAYLDKKRDLITGKVRIVGINREVRGANVIIVDDMIATGDTLVEAAVFLRKQGAAGVVVGATHHLYVPGAQAKLDASEIGQVVVTDTIVSQERSKKLKVLRVAELVVKTLKA